MSMTNNVVFLTRELQFRINHLLDIMTMITTNSAKLKDTYNELIFGTESNLPGIKASSQKHQNLIFEDCLYSKEELCNGNNANSIWATKGVNFLFNRYLLEIGHYIRCQTSHVIQYNNISADCKPTFDFDEMGTILTSALYKSTMLFEEETREIYSILYIVQPFLLIICLVMIILVYKFIFRTIVGRLNNEAKQTRSMLLMIPQEIVERVEEIQAYLEATQSKYEKDDSL
jgi:hypothetical protein